MAASCQDAWDICSHTTGAEPEQVRTKVLDMLRTNSGPGGVMTRPWQICGPSSNSRDSNNWPLGQEGSHVRAKRKEPFPRAVLEACLLPSPKRAHLPVQHRLIDHRQALKGSCPHSLPLLTLASKPLSYAMCRQQAGEGAGNPVEAIPGPLVPALPSRSLPRPLLCSCSVRC